MDEDRFVVGYSEFVKILNEETFKGDKQLIIENIMLIKFTLGQVEK